MKILFYALSLISITSNQAMADTAPWIGYDLSGAPCISEGQGFGPYNYLHRHIHDDKLRLVENAHFNTNVESLKGGALFKHDLYGDIAYTLRAFPNHHRALNTVIRYRISSGGYKKASLQQPECYLQRALNFAPEDATTHMLYGLYYHKLDMLDDALTKYEKALSLSPNNIEIQYNLALLLTEMERFEEAKQYAINVYAKKYPLQGLKNRLKAAGHW